LLLRKSFAHEVDLKIFPSHVGERRLSRTALLIMETELETMEVVSRSPVGDAERQACEDLVLSFSAYFDSNDLDNMLALFATDGVWKREDRDIAGADALREFMTSRPPSVFVRHALSNVRTTHIDENSAVVESYVVVYRHVFDGAVKLPAPLEGPEVFARYRDSLVKQSGTWKLLERKTTVEFKREA
jgi:hypothetical protein